MTRLKILLTIFLISSTLFATAQKPLFLDNTQALELRINDLISKLTLEEKIAQMQYRSPAIERLGIPSYNWWNECLHGVARSGPAAVFPQAIGLGATFDDNLLYRIGDAISDEARAIFNAALREGYRNQYGGLTFWTPNVNIFRDPRWGRGQETYGEDPYLTSRLGASLVKGLQGEDTHYLKVAACAKHFAVHSGPERVRHEFNAIVTLKDLNETYLPAFKALVDARVEAVMCAYNRTNAEPCCANSPLLTETLRKQWGFKGHVVTDCGAVEDIYKGHQFAKTEAEAAVLAVKHGVQLDCGSEYKALISAVKEGLITESEIDEALAVLLKTRFRLGLFDDPAKNPYSAISTSVINSEAHRTLAYEAALKSIVMLKNNGVLPLKNNLGFYYLTGPNAANIDVLLGNYYGVNPNMVTFLEGIVAKIAHGSQLQYKPGFLADRDNLNPIDWTTGEAKHADACIVVMGLSGLMEGEEGESIASSSYGDRLDYNVPKNQIDFLRKLRNKNKKPIVTIVTGGSPMNLAEVHELSDAILLCWYPGEEGGNAAADIIFGNTYPSGKLPVTFPKSLEQLPPYEDYSMKGRTYRYMQAEPLYPFGFGLTYARIELSNLKVSSPKIETGQTILVTISASNVGNFDGEDVAQLYLATPGAGLSNPVYSLKAYKRIKLNVGELSEIQFEITPDMLAAFTDHGDSVIQKGIYKLWVGNASPCHRSAELGAIMPVEASFEVK